jgi:plasmid replication initiation protein
MTSFFKGHIMALSNRNIVKQSYELNTARYRLSVVETDIIFKMVAEIKNEDKDFQVYTFKVTELEKALGRSLDRAYLKDTARNLMKKPLTIDRGKGNFLTIGWLSSFEYFADRGEIELCFDPKLKPYLLELQGRFVKADIRYIFKLSSEYSKRIYTMFKQWEKLGKYEVSVEDWQKLLEVPKSMLNYADFKRKVLDPAKNQINENTDLIVDYKEVKTGRKVTGLIWTIGKQIGKQLTIGDFTKDEIETEINPQTAIYYGKAIAKYLLLSQKEAQDEFKRLSKHNCVPYSKKLFNEALLIAREVNKQSKLEAKREKNVLSHMDEIRLLSGGLL